MNGKAVLDVPAKRVLNLASGFGRKLLCDGVTFSLGSACAFSCAFCYVPQLMRKSPHLEGIGVPHEDIVIRRAGGIEALRHQLVDGRGRDRFSDPSDRRVVYASPLVDVAANLDLVRETIAACKLILEHTHWDIRLLSKSHLLPKVADGIPAAHSRRMIYGVSTGTADDQLARAFEAGTALVSRRVASLRELQDRGLRTYGMICPSLPRPDGDTRYSYDDALAAIYVALRPSLLEHIWGEVINVRGESMVRTIAALRASGYDEFATGVARVSMDTDAWEEYARETFAAHAVLCPPGKLRFMQYVTKATRPWWASKAAAGAVLL